jgi:hypothetical protein
LKHGGIIFAISFLPMAKTTSAKTALVVRRARKPPVALRTAAVAAQAQAMLNGGDIFWQALPDSTAHRKGLMDRLAELHEAEDQFWRALLDRVNLILDRQRLDRDCWDLLTKTRGILREALGREWSPKWQRLGFRDQSLGIPAGSVHRFRMLCAVLEHIHEEPSCAPLLSAMEKVSADLAELLFKLDEVRSRLCRAAGRMRLAALALKAAITKSQELLRPKLRARDPRWLTLTSAGACAETCGSDAGTFPAGTPGLDKIADRRGPTRQPALRGGFRSASCLNFSATDREAPVTTGPGYPKNDAPKTTTISGALAWLLPPP